MRILLVLLLLLSAAACGGGPAAKSSDELLVWVDNTRTPAAKQYAAAHPELKIRVVTMPPDAGYVPTKVSLANKTGRGWPDVVFLTNPAETSTLAAPPFDYAAPLDEHVPADVKNAFASGTLDACVIGGKLYCLRNDIAPAVLWYDATLMREFGYQVPKSWEDYGKLGERVAKEHPGYLVGTMNGKYGAGVYFSGSGCPTREALSLTEVHIDTADPKCTRVADLLQPLAAAKAVSTVSPTDPAFAQLGQQGKILMLPGPAWFGDFMFKPSFKLKPGRVAAAPMPVWAGEDEAYSGQVGGGVYVVSRHAGGRAKAAADMITWLTTDVTLQAAQPTFPAHQASAEAWGKAKASDAFYAQDPVPVLKQAAARLRPGFGFVRYEAVWQSSFNETVVAAVTAGKPISGALSDWNQRLTQAATSSGYQVK
ncbi:ABC transporter substrate-binding protein [Nonomuraea basaltis]|uniref:ABC transporter substrate-binding protein n=1 Tax=Nonomuraea basaltis TaxID=2495887 RepID=UPI00110C6D72|nr:extracellular solute-binding protein [Nonomuraea basaltis]TMR90428.1 extracellular solute-binding protein [Nonomuraea basaltis]